MSRPTVLVKPVFPLKAMPVTSQVAALVGSNQATITWVNPPINTYDVINIERSIGGGSYVTIVGPTKGTTSYLDTQGYSVDTIYRVTAFKVGWSSSAQVVTGTVRSLPQVPSIVDAHRPTSDFVYHVAASWINPGHSNIAGFDVASSADGGSSWSGTTSLGVVTNTDFGDVVPHGNVTIRVRTRDTFGQVSAWNVWPTPFW